MRRSHVLALAAFVVVTPALAQSVQIQPIQRPIPTLPAPDMTVQQEDLSVQQEPDVGRKVMTLEEAQARISQLTKEKRAANEKLKEALAEIDEITKPGGSLVRAYCADELTSRNTAGAEQKCERYKCNQVSGLCNQSATSSSMCAPGYSWAAGDKCITLEEAQRQ